MALGEYIFKVPATFWSFAVVLICCLTNTGSDRRSRCFSGIPHPSFVERE